MIWVAVGTRRARAPSGPVGSSFHRASITCSWGPDRVGPRPLDFPARGVYSLIDLPLAFDRGWRAVYANLYVPTGGWGITSCRWG